jgi:hypothetical protein
LSKQANGRFEVQSQPTGSFADGIGRVSVTKTFHGDIVGSSEGEMLAFRAPVAGSAGYVLLERATVSVEGRGGTFVLQHFGLMEGGVPEARISVVPGSGTGDLAGIAGDMTIDPANNHSYTFTYTLPETA